MTALDLDLHCPGLEVLILVFITKSSEGLSIGLSRASKASLSLRCSRVSFLKARICDDAEPQVR